MIFPAVLLLAASLVSATPLLASEDLQPANKSSTSWACPEYGLAIGGSDITSYDNIPSWTECGRLCHVHKTCSHWTWGHTRSPYYARMCFLKSGEGRVEIDDLTGEAISGEES